MKVDRIYTEVNTTRYIVRQEDGRLGDGITERLIKLPDDEREELQVLLNKLKAKNLDDPNILRLRV